MAPDLLFVMFWPFGLSRWAVILAVQGSVSYFPAHILPSGTVAPAVRPSVSLVSPGPSTARPRKEGRGNREGTVGTLRYLGLSLA